MKSSAVSLNGAQPSKFDAEEADKLMLLFFALWPNDKSLSEPRLRTIKAGQYLQALQGYPAATVHKAVAAAQLECEFTPSIAKIVELIRKAEPQSGGLKAFRERDPDRTPAELKRRIEHLAELRRKFPDFYKADATLGADVHWADKPIEIRPLTAEECESLLRVTRQEVEVV